MGIDELTAWVWGDSAAAALTADIAKKEAERRERLAMAFVRSGSGSLVDGPPVQRRRVGTGMTGSRSRSRLGQELDTDRTRGPDDDGAPWEGDGGSDDEGRSEHQRMELERSGSASKRHLCVDFAVVRLTRDAAQGSGVRRRMPGTAPS